MDEGRITSFESGAKGLSSPLSEFFTLLNSAEALCNNCNNKLKFSSKVTSNLITHMKRCSPYLHPKYIRLKIENQEQKRKVIYQHPCQLPVKRIFAPPPCQKAFFTNSSHKAVTKSLIKSVACDELPIEIVESPTFKSLLLTAEPSFIFPSVLSLEQDLVPTVVHQMEELMRRELEAIFHVYLTVELWKNQNMINYSKIIVRFLDVDWRPREFVLAINTFVGWFSAESLSNFYKNVTDKFQLEAKVLKIFAPSTQDLFQVSLPGFILFTKDKTDYNQGHGMIDKSEGFTHLFSGFPERMNSFASAIQQCINDCLYNSEFLKSSLVQLIQKMADTINFLRESGKNFFCLLTEDVLYKENNSSRWTWQLTVMQAFLKKRDTINATLAQLQFDQELTQQDYLALSELVWVLLPFKEAIEQVEEGSNEVTSSCVCPIVIGLLKAMQQLQDSNLKYCDKLTTSFKNSITNKLLPYLYIVENRIASMLDPRFKVRWMENEAEKEEAVDLLKTHVLNRISKVNEGDLRLKYNEGNCSSKSPTLFSFMKSNNKLNKEINPVNEVELYLSENIEQLEEKPLNYWKKKSEELPTLSSLAKDYLGLKVSLFPSKTYPTGLSADLSTKNFFNRNNPHDLMFIRNNEDIFDQIKL